MRTVYILAMMLVFVSTPAMSSQSMPENVLCMALNIYHEARSKSLAGQIAVANVTLNRVKSDRFPDTVCEVVYQDHQFSWFWDGKDDTPTETKAWEISKMIAETMLTPDNAILDNTEGSLYYHADYVTPYWSKIFEPVKKIGTHIFYLDNRS
jgi:N-acetylmuramoyl-L-alanine amidase